MMYFSLVIPVYNRPNEIAELLQSLVEQTEKNFEVVIVEDGSGTTSEAIVQSYSDKLAIHYYYIPNGGPGQARNYGAAKARGDYLIVLDSDCVIPPGYLKAVTEELNRTHADAFGGPDRAAGNFTTIQKAIDYSMTSFFTTGGIRGGKKKLDKFYPRSFNMGIRKTVFEALGGFSNMRFGEDIDFSIRIYQAGYKVCLFSPAWVYHKRRTNWEKFYRQVYNSGIARINLYLKYPDSLKLVHLLPACFTIGVIVCLTGSFFSLGWLLPLLFYALLVWIDSGNFLAIPAAYIQLTGYGLGFLSACWNRLVLKKGEFSAFNKNFYK
jgi:glycosyltransferase involved in cell wall biosynthesis